MTECNRKKQLLGKSIRKIRVRRNMTQRELANAIEGDGSIRFTDEAIQSCVCTWRDWKEFLEKGKITREEYEDRKDGSMR